MTKNALPANGEAMSLTRRAALLGALASTAALTVPAAAVATSTRDPEVAFMDAVRALKVAAMRLDPTIKGIWVQHSFMDDEHPIPETGLLAALVFDRSGPALNRARRMRKEAGK